MPTPPSPADRQELKCIANQAVSDVEETLSSLITQTDEGSIIPVAVCVPDTEEHEPTELSFSTGWVHIPLEKRAEIRSKLRDRVEYEGESGLTGGEVGEVVYTPGTGEWEFTEY